ETFNRISAIRIRNEPCRPRDHGIKMFTRTVLRKLGIGEKGEEREKTVELRCGEREG
ncbi:unnamed protein product, partial [Musa banksii]